MADNKEYYDLLYAYSLGCLDREDLEKLKSYFDSEGTFPWQELGEFQNLSSLLPSILAIESPAPEVKDTVARKLYRIKSEIKANREKQKQQQEKTSSPSEESKPATGEKKESVPGDFEQVAPLRRAEGIINKETEESVESVPDKKEEELKTDAENEIDTLSDADDETPEKTFEPEKKSSYLEKKYSKENEKKGISKFIIIPLLVIVVAGIVLVYLKINSDVNKYEARITTLNEQVKSLSDKFNKNRELQLILTARDLKTVNMEAAGKEKEGFGKLFISPESSRGFIQVSNLPELRGGSVYQLWLNLNGKYYGLTSFQTTDKFAYVSFELPNIVNEKRVSFELTSGSADSPDKPGEDVSLKGNF